ncbi:MAG TPA: hypothetical protein DIC51_03265 [Coxiellaceae bacterium]|nr:hypothetical protein [Coxiellaceae bacterium]
MFLKKARKPQTNSKAIVSLDAKHFEEKLLFEHITHALGVAQVGFINVLENLYHRSLAPLQKYQLKNLLDSERQELTIFSYLMQFSAACEPNVVKHEIFNLEEMIQQILDYLSPYQVEQSCAFHLNYSAEAPKAILFDQGRTCFILLKIMTLLLRSALDGNVTIHISQVKEKTRKCKNLRPKASLVIIFNSEGKEIKNNYFNELVFDFCEDYNNALTANSLTILRRFITELNADIQFCVLSSNNEKTNNNNEIKQEANQKKNGCQFKLSLPVVIDATDRSFLSNNEETQGEVRC